LRKSARFYDVLFNYVVGFALKKGDKGGFEKCRFTHTRMLCFVLSFCEREQSTENRKQYRAQSGRAALV